MSDIDFFEPSSGEVILATHDTLQTRALGLTGVVNGNRLTATSPASMNINVDAGRIRIAGLPIDVSAGVAAVGASNASLARIDLICRDASGDVLVVPGALAVVEDLKGLGNWHQYTSPKPVDEIPEGIVLGAVFVAATVTALSDDDVWMFAEPVGDIKTVAASPGEDDKPLSEKGAVAAFAPIAHASNTSNPHSVTATQVGLGSVTNDVQVKASEKGVASGVATLDEDVLVVQNPASASVTPGEGVIPITGLDGTIAAGFIPVSGSSFWTEFPGTPVRVSDTSFSVTDTANANLYDKQFGPGTIIKWEKSGGGFQCAKIAGASYSSGTVTYTIVGNTLAAAFTDMKYCINPVMEEVFIVPGTMPSSAQTNIAKTIHPAQDIYIFSAQAKYTTAPTTTGGTWDINDDGTTIFDTKPPIAAAAKVGTETVCNCLLATATTAVAKDSEITLDYDGGHATTPGADAYVYFWYMPVSWRYRT